MQIIYAAPFVLLSLLGFVLCVIVAPMRRFALSALVAPVAFGICSIIGWIGFALVAGDLLKINLGPATGIHGLIEGLLFYALPGVLGSWLAVVVVRFFEWLLLPTEQARKIALRVGITIVAFPFGFVFILASIAHWFGLISTTWWLIGALLGVSGGIFISACVYIATRSIQGRRSWGIDC
jgi:hypothetical protein